jgi:AcrR family transcriptional regulator
VLTACSVSGKLPLLVNGSIGVVLPGQKIAEEARRSQILAAAYDIATRHGLEGLTIRRVAGAAGLSHGLVHFHFKTKDALLAEVLDRLLARMAALQVGPEIASIGSPLERLLTLLKQEMVRVTLDRRDMHLFFDFWLLGMRHAGVRAKMRAQLDGYREAFRPVVEQVLAADPERFAGVTSEALASVAVAFVKGCAVQSVIDPRGLDVARVTAAADVLLAELKPEPAVSKPARRSSPATAAEPQPSRRGVAVIVGFAKGLGDAIAGLLESQGFAVRRVDAVPEAIGLLEEISVELVVASGRCSAGSVVQLVDALGEPRTTRVLVLLAGRDPDAERRYRAAGLKYVMSMPVTAADLLRAGSPG